MNHAKEKIKLSFDVDSKKLLLKKILEIIDKRWVKQMDHPLYGAALYLNPRKLQPLIRDNEDAVVGQLRGSFHDVLARMVEDEELRDKIDAQSLDYEALRGDAFSNKMAKQNLEKLSPCECCTVLLFTFSQFNSSKSILFLISNICLYLAI